MPVIARAHSLEEVVYLEGLDADQMIMGEGEIAKRMIELSVTMTGEGAASAA